CARRVYGSREAWFAYW
nr:immunoglobulin heavy chain junction region [Mus musculus]NSM06870.1 immunoglobulin heavy chain junction region [Mus musculus]NSM07821.1 immunoglobulin heavy chain junction region [Mus musculus]NSM09138.1 immunoglobulin heavy chain junction region [Mus musculus]